MIKINFISKKNNYRCFYSNRKNEIIAKAVGIKKNYFPLVLDTTAGLGRDAFILSFLGCHVIMIERHPVIIKLLQEGLKKAYEDEKIGFWLKKRLHLIHENSMNMLSLSIPQPDVIYLDPMYPLRKKKSLPKKEIQFFQKLIGNDKDSYQLLNIAKKLAKKRIVVKRPYYAKKISTDKVDFIIKSKKHRFDIYLPSKK